MPIKQLAAYEVISTKNSQFDGFLSNSVADDNASIRRLLSPYSLIRVKSIGSLFIRIVVDSKLRTFKN